MKRLPSFPSYYLETIMFVILNTDRSKGSEVFLYFFPSKEQKISAEEYAARWEIVHVAANEVGFEEIKKGFKETDYGLSKSRGWKSIIRASDIRDCKKSIKKISTINRGNKVI